MKQLSVPASQARCGDYLFLHDRYMVIESLHLLPRTDRLSLTLCSGGTVVTIFCARDQALLLRRPTESKKIKAVP